MSSSGLDQPIGPWLAQLIETHSLGLAALLTDAAQRDMPFYASLARELVYERMVVFCGKLAETAVDGDVEIMRAYLEPTATDRMRAGAAVQGYLHLADLFEPAVGDLIAVALPNSTQAALANRYLRALTLNVRMIFGKINMRILTDVSSD